MTNPTPIMTNNIKPFTLENTLIGLEMSNVDTSILSYLKFLSNDIAFIKPTFFHTLPKITSLDPYFDWQSTGYVSNELLDTSTFNRMKDEVLSIFKNEKSIESSFQLSHGTLLESYIDLINKLKPKYLVVGKKSKINYHSILPKNLLRLTNSSLLQIPSDTKNQLKKILVPVDFSENSARALKTAAAINKALESDIQIVALNVYESPELNMYKISRSYKQYERIIRLNIADAFSTFIHKNVPEDSDQIAMDFVKKDMPGFGRYIVNYSNKNQFDLIVMGTKGHSKMHYLFLGSTTEKVLTLNDRIPTLVVK